MTESELYLTGVVIANGIPDVDDDVLTAKDIKIIFAKYTQRLTDIQHNDISYYGIEVLANWISGADTIIAGRTVPAKSWLATIKVMNPEIIDLVNQGELRGFSLSSTYVGEVDKKNDERVSYSDLQSSEEIIPIRISLVKKPANGFAFEEADYETFINKMEANMSDESKFTLGDLKNIFKFKSDLEEDLIEKAAPEEDGDAGAGEAEKSVDALFEKVDILLEKVSIIEEALKRIEESESEEKADDEKIEEAEEEADDEKIEKAEEEADDDKKEEAEEEVDKKEEDEKIEKAEEEADKKEEEEESDEKKEDEESDDESEEKSEDESEDKKIGKSAEEVDTKKINKGITTKAHDVPEVPIEKASTFFNRTKRDHLGRKIRQ